MQGNLIYIRAKIIAGTAKYNKATPPLVWVSGDRLCIIRAQVAILQENNYEQSGGRGGNR